MRKDFAALVSKVQDLQGVETEVKLLAGQYLKSVGYLGYKEDVKVRRVDTASGEPDYFVFDFKHTRKGSLPGAKTTESFRVPVLAVQRALDADV
jgi:hypothetical protein